MESQIKASSQIPTGLGTDLRHQGFTMLVLVSSELAGGLIRDVRSRPVR